MNEDVLTHIENELKAVFGNNFKIENSRPLGGGCINQAFRLLTSHGELFTKWNYEGPDDMFLREAESLEELLKANTVLKIPEVYYKSTLKGEMPAILVTEHLTKFEGSRAEQDKTLGQGIAQMHKFCAEKYGFYHDNYCGSTLQDNTWNNNWPEFYAKQRIGLLVNYIDKARDLHAKERKVYDELIDKIPEILNHNPKAALNHGDLWGGNFMYSGDGPSLIDPASYYADREFDLAMMRMFGGFSKNVWDAYEQEYPLPPEWRERNDLYMLYHYLNHYYLFGGFYGSQALNIAEKYIK